ncbi:hypothetical protein T440DRAFT_517986 [Plenodomus tracheiphilus IPT5]|uniref:Transcriptional regulatory protein DEP1 n=1 Tax=Plenodomus tracheiphilus IPT5 TaxID=1408161 RepID=A0A6A7B591_9PLEO|nr:hypothetical protein T440DRAFT_517986 [Plenodomus tracheiphilus IPT5]
MSAHHAASRSTSTPTPDAAHDALTHSSEPTTTTTTTHSRPDPSPISSPVEHPTATDDAAAAAMLSTLTAPPTAMLAEALAADATTAAYDDGVADNRSSSLSDIGDASDDQSEATPRPAAVVDMDDDDSEAETERLENTPRTFTRVVTDNSMRSEPIYARTPSKLAHTKTVQGNDSAPPTPSATNSAPTIGEATDPDNPLHSLSLAAAAEAATLFAGSKRKRDSVESSPADEHADEPARKRSSTAKNSALDGLAEAAANQQDEEEEDVRDELETAEERLSQLAHEELDLEERQANIAAETVNELATVAKHTKPRKGGRRGKRKMEDPNYAYNEAIQAAGAHDAEGDGDGDEDHDAVFDDEVAKKKHAIDKLAEIEKKFKLFREKLCDEQMAQLDREMDLLRQPNCVHPEYLAMIKCVDERRADKIAYEKRLQEYKQQNLDIITAAERHQMHSQYFQTVRHEREEILEECNQRVFELQRGRRQLGCDETEYMIKLPDKRSDQIRQQTAYNLEVSILSGVAKYVGFPAAPDISAARPADIDQDMRAMKIATRVPPPPPSFRTYNRLSTADEAAAEEQFLQSTPWANPRHPSHQDTRFPADPSRISSYQTPAGQRRMVDLTAPNGSASTIEANSNPPSSNAHNLNGRISESESPVLQVKRPPTEHIAYAETPGTNPRSLGMHSREPYGIMSSPAASHAELSDEQGGHRWVAGGMRPLHAGPPTALSSSSGAGRPDGVRPPITQRNGLGTISVGNTLFGR